jgi:ABC-type polysaccharide/polyol phosphate transport system ATPase subunit
MTHIRLNRVSVRIPIYDAHALRLFKRTPPKIGKVGSHSFSNNSHILHVQALTDIDLDITSGDRIALIGHNGAGKTTLLRYMAGIYPAASGHMDRKGSVYLYGGSVAINADATGYENIHLAMRLGGLPKKKMDEYIRDVEEFTELGDYLSLPARIYSAGMWERLSFAIATMHTPDILLIDENIGAGDANFADKVEKRITDFTGRANIVVVASHSNSLLQKMCTKGVVFEAGRIIFQGSVDAAIKYYEQMIAAGKPEKTPSEEQDPPDIVAQRKVG